MLVLRNLRSCLTDKRRLSVECRRRVDAVGAPDWTAVLHTEQRRRAGPIIAANSLVVLTKWRRAKLPFKGQSNVDRDARVLHETPQPVSR